MTEPVSEKDIDLSHPRYYFNREYSEIEFQRRVLHEALDERNPLLERVKFLAIFTTNMDEFFMKRVGGLKQQMSIDLGELTPDGRTPIQQWKEVFDRTRPMFERQYECYHEVIQPALDSEGIHIVSHDEPRPDQQERLRQYFEQSVLPILTPLTFDPAHSFPFISNLSLSLAVLTREEGDDDPIFSRVKIPKNRPRLVPVNERMTFVPLEEIVAANLEQLFPDVDILEHATFRVTRNAQVRRNQEVAEDLIEMIEEVLRERRFATVVRLEVEEDMPEHVKQLLLRELNLDEREMFELPGPLDFRDLMTIAGLPRPDLKVDEWIPQPHPRLMSNTSSENQTSIFSEISKGDILVHHPYHSFEQSVNRFFAEAAHDPDVLAIKAAIYRTATESKIIESLINAVRNGKQVAVMVELKARFDEENNLRWVERLEEEGIHVAYGTIGYKTHSKIALVVREEQDEVKLYSHVGTGNYHSETAKTYTDLGLLTVDSDIGHDLTRLFNFFTGHSHHKEYRKMLVAPGNMREGFTQMIRREARHAQNGEGGYIIAKMNSLEDPAIVRELYEASRAGVNVELIVRGICRLRPGVEDVSENISVRSIVGRFLEHSRIYYFGNAGDPCYYLGSADWMTRNLDRRVEAVVPIEDTSIQKHLWDVLQLLLADNRRSWVLQSDGTYYQLRPDDDGDVIDIHRVLMEKARAEGHGRSPYAVINRTLAADDD